MTRLARVYLLLLALCLVGASYNHLRDVLQGGWLPYHFAPLWLNAYWTTLTILDPLAIVLLLWRPRWGLLLTLVIIVTDVAVNTYWKYQGQDAVLPSSFWGLQVQTLYLGFVLGCFPWLWRETQAAH